MKATKRITRLCSILLAVVIVMAMSVSSAFAAEGDEPGTGSITVTNATANEDYAGYKIFDVTYNQAGNVAYTITSINQFYEAVSSATNLFELQSTTVSGTYNVIRKDGVEDSAIITWLNGLITKDSTYTADLASSKPTDGEVVWSNVPYGYYLITSSLGSVVTVDQNTPDVEILDKNQKPGGEGDFTKTVDGDDEVVEIGQEFDYRLKFTGWNYDGVTPITEYTITDTLDSALDLVYTEGDSTYGVSVTVGTQAVADATVQYNEVARTLTINIPWANMKEDSTFESFKYSSSSTVTVSYTAKLNANAAIQEDIKNDATLTWDGNDEGTSTEETVQTYAMAIMKVDEQGNPLSGAEFAVTKQVSSPTEENPDATISQKVNVSQVMDEEGNPVAGVYVVDPDSKSNTVVSPNSGLIVIKGVDNVTYTLTETKAPNGYNLLDEPETVTPVSNGSTTITIYKDENGNVTEQVTENKTDITSPVKVTAKIVENKAGSELPSTGGMGTTVIYIVGGVLVAGAAVLLVTRRRMHA